MDYHRRRFCHFVIDKRALFSVIIKRRVIAAPDRVVTDSDARNPDRGD